MNIPRRKRTGYQPAKNMSIHVVIRYRRRAVGFVPRNRIKADEYLQKADQKYAVSDPSLSAWMEENLAEGLTVFDFPRGHRRFIRTTNGLERVNKEIRRRTRVVGVRTRLPV